MYILVINSGSSSIKFSIFEAADDTAAAGKFPWPRPLFTGEISGVGGATLDFERWNQEVVLEAPPNPLNVKAVFSLKAL